MKRASGNFLLALFLLALFYSPAEAEIRRRFPAPYLYDLIESPFSLNCQ